MLTIIGKEDDNETEMIMKMMMIIEKNDDK